MGTRGGVVVAVVSALVGLVHAGPNSRDLADQGKYREAIAEAQRLIKLQPKSAAPLEALAYVYLHAGMGEAARRTARAAIQLEPNRALAHEMLGWVLEFDTLGRRFGRDHDRAGALAELARARSLDPRMVELVVEHARLLERGFAGGRFDPGCDLAAATEAWRIARTLADTDEHRIAHATVLLASGSAASAEGVLRSAQPSDERDALLVAAIAVQRGGALASKAAASPAVLQRAWYHLFTLRLYDVARALGVSPQGPIAKIEKSLVRFDAARFPRTDPRSVVVGLVRFALDDPYPKDLFLDPRTEGEIGALIRLPLDRLRAADVPHDVLTDSVFATSKLAVDGTSPLWRVTVEDLGDHSASYVVLDGGVAKVLGSMEAPGGVGRHVRALVGRNDLASAGRLLDWLATDVATRKQPAAKRFASVWTAGGPRDAQTMLLAAAMLAPDQDASVRAVLASCASTAADAREACDATLAGVLSRGREWQDLLAHTVAWTARAADPVEPGWGRIRALAHLGRLAEGEKVADELLAKHPSDPRIVWLRGLLALQRHDLPEALRRLDALAKGDDVYANEVAWLRVTEGSGLETALALVHRVTKKPKPSGVALNTQALIEAELGDLAAAKADEWASIDRRPHGAVNDADWYVIGRIAEQLGLRDDAIADYRKIPKSDPDLQKTVYELAQQRLKALGVQ